MCWSGRELFWVNAEQEFLHLSKNREFLQHGPFLGACALPKEHPLNVGMLGMHGNYSTNL